MNRLRAILPILLVLVMTLVTACGGNVAQEPPTYTPEKITEIQQVLKPVKQVRERMPELKEYIDEKDWNDVDSFIHGPLGGIRQSLGYVNRTLLEDDQPPAKETAERLFKDLERIDSAADAEVYADAVRYYNRAVEDLDQYLDLIPTEPTDSETSA
ncbi:photosystem II protein PsbQ [Spirulina sp. CS-785/01]|uniref:photosystem II protein PsbQ n=1 Tax=Spirulina sp. CS-785/01 TaxID=3021716 RepID=UPI00232CE2FD|nr:photosystem II protein PsbQ [Spirulina sp. CS-785/01]MDB9315037.1 photosystem II protein PsbQ [Spirulina sp. CS-785/01]